MLRALAAAAAAAAAVAETKMAGSKCGFCQRAGMVPGTPGGARGRARRSPRGGGGVRAEGGRRGHEGAPPGRGWRERGRGHRGHHLQG